MYKTFTRKIMLVPLLAMLLSACLVPSLSLFGQVGKEDSVERWISELANPAPTVRENAEAQILALGEEAMPLVRIGLQSSDLEISSRCKFLLDRLEVQRRQRLSKLFLEAAEGDDALANFYAWPEFARFADDQTVLCRKLYLEMCEKIRLVFTDYDFAVDQNGPALKQAARLALIPEKHPSVSSDILLVAYLFLSDRAERSVEQSADAGSGSLFNSVEILEGINFISNSNHASVIRNSKYRKIIDVVVADWVLSRKEAYKIPDGTIFKLVYETQNSPLIDSIARNYGDLDRSKKLSFIDIVARAAGQKKSIGLDQCIKWLGKPLADNSTLVNSRFRKNPAEKVEVSAARLAEAVLAKRLASDVENPLSVELEKVFGIYPRSGKGFLIIKSQKDRQLLSEAIRVRMQQPEPVK